MPMHALKNPLPSLSKATDSLARLAILQRDLFLLKSEMKTVRQVKRIALLVTSLITLNLALTIGLFWLTQALHEAGWSSFTLSILGIVLLGGITGALIYFATHLGGKDLEHEIRSAGE